MGIHGPALRYTQTTIIGGASTMITCKLPQCAMIYNKAIAAEVKCHDKHHGQIFLIGPTPSSSMDSPRCDEGRWIGGVWTQSKIVNGMSHCHIGVDSGAPLIWKKYALKALRFAEEELGGAQFEMKDWVDHQHGIDDNLPRYKIYLQTSKIVFLLFEHYEANLQEHGTDILS
jgi:hypothetical protein